MRIGDQSMSMLLRRRFEGILNRIALALLKMRVTPNASTLFALLLSLGAGALYAYGGGPQGRWPIWGAVLMLLSSGFFDAMDGAIARMGGGETKFGGFLDSVLDRYADAAVIIGVSVGFRENVTGIDTIYWGLIALTGSIIVSYTRAKAESLGVSLKDVGLAERPERILIIAVTSLALLPQIGVILLAFLSNVTVLQRGIAVHRGFKRGSSTSPR